MKHLTWMALVSTLLTLGCTDRVLRYDRSRPPLDAQTQIPILPTFPDGLVRPSRFIYGELARPGRTPLEGTVELSNSIFAKDQNESDACDDTVLDGVKCMVCYFACLPVAMAAAVVYLPYLAATGNMQSNPEEAVASSAQAHASWLTSVIDDRQWSVALDKAYVSGLNQALGWKDSSAEAKPAGFWSLPTQNTFFAHISRIELSDSGPGEYSLFLCAWSTIHRGWGSTPRTFETCQRGTIATGAPDDSPTSGAALRETLIERARLLSGAQAQELCSACTPRQ